MKKIFILFLAIQSIYAQSYMDVYKKIGDLYLNASSFKVTLKVNITYQEGYEEGNQSLQGLIIKSNKQIYTEFADKINIADGAKNIFIDRNSHIIMISDSKYDEKLLKKNLFSGFENDEYLKKYDFKLLRADHSSNVFEITPINPADIYKRIELELYPDYSFKSVMYEMNPVEGNTVARILITYGNSEFNADIPKEIFSTKEYILLKDKAFVPVGIYSGYKVINQIKK